MSKKTTVRKNFSEEEIQEVWEKGIPIEGENPEYFRRDICGAWMQRDKHGDIDNNMGWEIDHIIPVSKKGTHHIDNLRPLYWENNRSKGDDYPFWNCETNPS